MGGVAHAKGGRTEMQRRQEMLGGGVCAMSWALKRIESLLRIQF